MSAISSIDVEERRDGLRAVLRERGAIGIDDAAALFNVHSMTIRRDLDYLEQKGLARRVRGGAVAIEEEDFHARMSRNLVSKKKIAAKLLPLVPRAGAVCFDASSTIYQLAVGLQGIEQLSVVTNGLGTFEVLQQRPNVRPYLTGGEAEATNFALVGPIAVRMVEEFLVSDAFLSCTCLDARIGTSEPTVEEAELKRAMASVASRVTLAVDSSKLGMRSVVRSVALDGIHRLVTELDPADERLDPFRELVEIL